MTGAGTGSLAFAKESTFKGSLSGAPDYWSPGRNPTITNGPELRNQLQRMREAGAIESVESVAQNLEGAFGVEATISSDTFGDVLDIVFNDGTGSSFQEGRANTSRWYVGVDYLDGTVERELIGCVPTDFSVTWQQGGNVRYSITFVYADEGEATSITPSSITSASDGTTAAFHDASLDIDTVTQQKTQSWQLSITDIARLQFGEDRVALDAVMGTCQATLDQTAIITETDQLDLAYGNTGSSSPDDQISGVSASASIGAFGTSVATFNLSNVTPDTYAWQDVVSDANTTESMSLQVNGVSVA